MRFFKDLPSIGMCGEIHSKTLSYLQICRRKNSNYFFQWLLQAPRKSLYRSLREGNLRELIWPSEYFRRKYNALFNEFA